MTGGLSLLAQGVDVSQLPKTCVDMPPRLRASGAGPVQAAIKLQKTPPKAASMPRDDPAAKAPKAPGDIVPRPPARIAFLRKWPADTLSIRFLPGGHFTRQLRARVIELASEWTQFANINFSFDDAPNADIVVGFKPGLGHWSYVGTDAQQATEPDDQTMNLDLSLEELTNARFNTGYNQGVVRHEFGHALGAIHEHQNPAGNPLRFRREETYRYFARFGFSRDEVDRNIFQRYEENSLLRFSTFDIKSIMLYHFPAELLASGEPTPENHVISDTDKDFIAQLYPGRYTPGTGGGGNGGGAVERELEVGGAALSGKINKNAVDTYVFTIRTEGRYEIRTQGYTQLRVNILEPANLQVTVTSPDLVNQSIIHSLAAGRHRLSVEHRYPGGVGEYAIFVRPIS